MTYIELILILICFGLLEWEVWGLKKRCLKYAEFNNKRRYAIIKDIRSLKRNSPLTLLKKGV